MRKVGLAAHLRHEAPGAVVYREMRRPEILITPAKRNVKFIVSDEKNGARSASGGVGPQAPQYIEKCGALKFSSLRRKGM